MRKNLLVWALLLGATLPAYAEEKPEISTTVQEAESRNLLDLRRQSIQDIALVRGMYDGRRTHFVRIQQSLQRKKTMLDNVFEVGHLYLEDGLLQPPVVLTGENIFQMAAAGRSADWSQVRYQIVAPAQLVTRPIEWVTFLVADSDINGVPPSDNPLLRPRDAAEQAVYQQFYQAGFSEGEAQSEAEVVARMKTLTSIVRGMYTYHVLVQNNVLQPVTVAKSYVPVSGNDSLLTLSTNIVQLATDARFNQDPRQFKPHLELGR